MPLDKITSKELEIFRELSAAEDHLVSAFPELTKEIRELRKRVEKDIWLRQLKREKQ